MEELTVGERRRRTFSESFKRKKVQEIETGQARICEICRAYQVSYTNVYRWIKKAMHAAIQHFRDNREKYPFSLNALYRTLNISKQAVYKYKVVMDRKAEEMAYVVGIVSEVRREHPTMCLRDIYYKVKPEGIGRDRFERVNGIIKNNYLYHRHIDGYDSLKKEVDRAVSLYNNDKPHIKLQRLSPVQFEKRLSLQCQNRDSNELRVQPITPNNDI